MQRHILILNPMVLRSDFIGVCCEFVFETKGRDVMYGMVPGNNEKAMKFNRHIGFTEKCRFEGAFQKGVDYVIMELRKENCKYLLREAA